jgi:hypothetical protein
VREVVLGDTEHVLAAAAEDFVDLSSLGAARLAALDALPVSARHYEVTDLCSSRSSLMATRRIPRTCSTALMLACCSWDR